MSKFKLEVIENISISKVVEVVSKYALSEEEIDKVCDELDKCSNKDEWDKTLQEHEIEVRRVDVTGNNGSITVESIDLIEGSFKK